MSPALRTPAEQRSVLEDARAVLAELAADTTRLGGEDVSGLMGLADEVASAAGAVRVALTVEAARRSSMCPRELGSWVVRYAPSLRQGGASAVARLASEVVAPGRAAGLSGGEWVEPEPASPVGIVWSAVRSGRLTAPNAVAVLREEQHLHDRLVPEAVPTVTGALVDLVVAHGPGTMRRLRPRLVAEHGVPGELDGLQERLRSGAYLSTRFVESAGLTQYELVMTPEQAAVLEAAIGPLSKPAPNEETKERDLRPAGQRRVEALTEVCRRSAGLDADAAGPAGAAASAPSVLHVTVALSDLQEGTGCGEVLASTAGGAVLGPAQLRRVACDAVLVPYVLGTGGEVVDQGMAVRLFTRAQRRRFWVRDRHCTYPGCTVPGSWCRVHHVRHWTDLGTTDLSNGALLCERHHTVVHQRRLWASVREEPDEDGRSVLWDLHDGSYDRALALITAREALDDGLDQRRRLARERLRAMVDPDQHAPHDADRELDQWLAHLLQRPAPPDHDELAWADAA